MKIISQPGIDDCLPWEDCSYPARTICSGESNAFIEPERNPSRSRVTNLNPRFLKIRVNSAAISGVIARTISSRAISIRAMSPWWRTRNWRNPSRRSASSPCSTADSASVVTARPYSIRDERHAEAGLSQMRNPASRAKLRISSLPINVNARFVDLRTVLGNLEPRESSSGVGAPSDVQLHI